MLLPGLECLVNRFATAQLGSYPHRDPIWALEHPEIRSVSFDPDMHQKVLYARNALKWINSSRQPRLDCLEIAAVSVALRLARREGLVSGIGSREFARLLGKLEKYRKRARRAVERAHGKQAYEQAAERWRRLLDWMHVHIFHFRSARWSSPSGVLRRQQREQTRNLALSLVEPSVDPAHVIHIADLVRREIRRGRHPFTLRELLADPEKSHDFSGWP